MRIRGAKTELEEAGESTEGMAESTASLREEIMALSGVDIMQDETTFKSTYAIMDELSQKWEGLSDIAQASITELIAGKHQGNVMSSLMANFDIARDALETSANSAGSAMAEHAKWSDSLEARINKLKATWQSLSQSFMSSNFLKGGISAITGFVDALDSVVSTLGTIPTLLTAFATFKSFSGGGFFKVLKDEATGAATGITNAFSQAAEITQNNFKNISLQRDSSFKTQIDTDINALNKYIEKSYEFANLGKEIDESTFNNIFKGASASAKQWASEGKLATQTVDDFVKSQQKLQVSTLAQNKSLGNASAIIKEYYDGCQNVGMSTDDFRDAIAKTNPLLASQLTDTNNAKSALLGYGTSMVGATAKTVALTVATTALNTALTMGLSALISWGISALDKWIVTADELAEKVDEVITKYKDQHSELMKLKGDYDTTNEESLISKYGELSKGVNAFGENISLTADEYAEYQNIVNTIADQIPSLVSGYDSQGNAILSCAGDVGQLTAEYEKLIKAQNDEVLINSSKDINKDFKNAVKDAEHDTAGFFGWNWTKEIGLGDSKLSTQSAEIYENILNSADAVNEFNKAINTEGNDLESFLDNSDVDAMSELLEKAGFEKNGSFWSGKESNADHVRRALEEDASKVKDILGEYYSNLEVEAEGKKQQAQAALSNALDLSDSMYYGMSDTMKNIANQTVNSFDFGFFADLEKQGISVETYISDMLDSLNSLSSMDESSIETAFNLRTQFNGGDISYGEYVDSIQEIGGLIDTLALPQETRDAIKNALNIDGITEQYNALSKRLQDDLEWDESVAENLLDGLSSKELSVLTKIIPEIDANATIEEIQSLIDSEMVISGLIFDLNIEVETAGIESLNTALAESVTATGLSSESISALKSRYSDLEKQGWDLSSMFEETSHGIHLNRNELSKFESELSSQKLSEATNDLERMKEEYDKLDEAIRNCTDSSNISDLLMKRDSLAQEISEAATLASQYQALTSSYNKWINAEESGNERDMYENVISGLETVEDEISRGWADDGTVAFLEMVTGQTDLASKSGSELKAVWESLDDTIKNTSYSVKDFFTTDDDGNSTSKGVYNFLDAVGQLEEEAFNYADVVKRDSDDNIIGFDFELAGGTEAIAEALGVSEEIVDIMVRAADDAGFVVDMEGAYSQYANMASAAETATAKLKELSETNKALEKAGGDFEFDFNTSDVESIKDDLEQAQDILDTFKNEDGTFKVDSDGNLVDGVTDAMTLVSTLQARLDYLTQDYYCIGLTTNEEQFEEPLEKLQTYGDKVSLLNQLEINPSANADEIEKLNGELDEIAEYFANLDEDTKVEIGLDADDGVDEVKNKIESGQVTIPATLDIQANMDKNIEDLKDLMLLNYLDPDSEEAMKIKIRLGIETEVDDSDVQEATENTSKEVGEKIVEGLNGTFYGDNPDGVSTGADGQLKYRFTMNADGTVNSVEIEGEGKIEEAIDKEVDTTETEQVEVETDVKLTGGTVDDTQINDAIQRSKGERHREDGKTWEYETDVKLTEGEVDASDVENAAKETAKEQSGETTTIEKDVQLEFNINDYVDELSKFKDVAKELEGLEDITVKIGVELNGELNTDTVSNLSEFADGAKSLQDVWNKDNSVTLTVTYNSTIEGGDIDIAELSSFADAANALQDVWNKDNSVTVTANLNSNLDKFTGNINDLTIFANAANNLKGFDDDELKVTVNATITTIPTSQQIAELENFADAVNKLPKSDVTVNVSANVDTANIQTAISTLETLSNNSDLFKTYSANVTVTATGKGDVDALKSSIDKIEDKSVTVSATTSGEEALGNLKSAIDAIQGKSVTVSVTTVYSEVGSPSGDGEVNGTAHVNGTAFANGTAKSGRAFKAGNWGTENSGMALMGELGRELIVRDGRFFTVGDNGAGFYPYKKGDIIFNHKQTEELFENGYVTSNGGRGRTFASGTAFSGGTALPFGKAFYEGIGGGLEPTTSGSDSSSDDDDDDDSEEEIYDWIEKLLERFDRAIDMLDAAANNIYNSFDKRESFITDEISTIEDQLTNQKNAYDSYMDAAEYFGSSLDESWKEKIRNGALDISVLDSENDEDLIDAIEDYQEWYEKALDAEESIQELKETLSSLYAARVENVATEYEGILGVVEHEKNILEEYINQSEAQGMLVSSKYYDALASNERENLAELENQKAKMLRSFNEAMASGLIDEGSEAYYDMVASIDEVTMAIAESNTALLEYSQTLQQLDWEIFDLLQDKISAITDETDFLIELLSSDKLYDDNGQLTNEGKATMGLHGVAYNTLMTQADQAGIEAAKLKEQLEADPYDTELEERYREMIALQQEYILSAESEKNAIKDLVEEGIQSELDALDERIEKYNEALESQKDLYEYQKKVSEQTSEIASLQKQLAAYEGDNSEEAKAKIQELRVSLQEAEADLEETEYDKYISDTQQMLDDITLEYEELLNTRMDNIDYLVEQMIDEINADSSAIGDTIREAADSVGYTLTDSMKSIWDEDALSTKNVITTYGDKFLSEQTTTNATLSSINSNLQTMINELNEDAASNTKSANTSSSSKKTTKTAKDSTTTSTKAAKTTSGGDGVPKIGDRVKYESGQYYYDSQGQKPLGSHNLGEYVYITNINTRDWATHGYHISTGNKLGKGDLGWLKLNQISGYATGKKNFANDEVAWTQEDGKEFIIRPSDGAILTPIAKGDSVLTSASSKNIWDFANSPAEFIRDNLNIGSNSTPHNANSQNNYTQYLDKVVFNLPNVKNYEQFLSAMQKDKNFERLIQSMTIDQISGKSSLGKGKSIR